MNTASKRLLSRLFLFGLIAVLISGCSAQKPVTVELLVAETPEVVLNFLEPAPLPQAAGCGGLAGATGSGGSQNLAESDSLQGLAIAASASPTKIAFYGPVYVPSNESASNVTFKQVWTSTRDLLTKGDPGFSF
jgi:hypothetical protein